MTRAPRGPGRAADALRAAVLESTEDSPTLAARLGISPQRVRQIRAAAGLIAPTSARGAALIRRLETIADARGESPEAALDRLERVTDRDVVK